MQRLVQKYSDKVSVIYDTKQLQYGVQIPDNKVLWADDEEESHLMAQQQDLFFKQWGMIQ